MLAQGREGYPQQLQAQEDLGAGYENWTPRNAPALEYIKERFDWCGYDWEAVVFKHADRSGKVSLKRKVDHKNIPTINGIAVPLHDLITKPLELFDGYQSTPVTVNGASGVGPVTTTINEGRFETVVTFEEVIIDPEVQTVVERALGQIAHATTALLVRIDMAPMEPNNIHTFLPFYEVETAPGGLHITSLVNPYFAEHVFPLADVALCLDPDWVGYYRRFIEPNLGWKVLTTWGSVPPDSKVYVSCAPHEVQGRRDLITDPFASKAIVLPLSGGHILRNGESFEDLDARYPEGFVLKPDDGWGGKEVYIYDPSHKSRSTTKTYFRYVLEEQISTSRAWVVQPFYPPQTTPSGLRIWRIYAMRETREDRFRLIGGMWNSRPWSLKIHGASDALFGPVFVS